MELILHKPQHLLIKEKVKKYLTGLSVPQEYVCVDLASYQNPLSVFLSTTTSPTVVDITTSHLFLGYKPVIIGIPFNRQREDYRRFSHQTHFVLTFSNNQVLSQGHHKNPVASLSLRLITEKKLDSSSIFLFEGTNGAHNFLSFLHQFINHQRERRKNNSPTNVNLNGNLYDQVRIAYAVPRIISIMTTGEGDLVNMFPTDLHGSINDNFYISSLRIGGKASDQVEKFKTIVLSDVTASFYKDAYGLGKNHMQGLQAVEKFPWDGKRSATFNLPLPTAVNEYRELKQVDSLDVGIHRLHIYKTINHVVGNEQSKLAHIHQYYAQWRIDNGMPTDFLLR